MEINLNHIYFKILEVIDPTITVKVTGKQWYWHYEYNDLLNDSELSTNFSDVSFDSYLLPNDSLEKGNLRLLDVDNKVVLPVDTPIRFIVTASDVLHSWAIPSLGIKMDCIPGRLNQTSAIIQREGLYYGQCSEICGVYIFCQK